MIRQQRQNVREQGLALTNIRIALLIVLILIPIQSIFLIRLGNLIQVPITRRLRLRTFISRGIFLPGPDRALHPFVVEIRVVLLLERRQQTLQFLQSITTGIPLFPNPHQILAQLIYPLPRQSYQNTQLARLLPRRRLDDLPSLTLLHLRQLLLQLLHMQRRALDLSQQRRNPVLNLPPQPQSLSNQFLPLLRRIAQTLLLRLMLLSPLLADLLTLVLALHNAVPLLAAIAADIVVTDAVIDTREGDIGWLVAFVLAVEAGQC